MERRDTVENGRENHGAELNEHQGEGGSSRLEDAAAVHEVVSSEDGTTKSGFSHETSVTMNWVLVQVDRCGLSKSKVSK